MITPELATDQRLDVAEPLCGPPLLDVERASAACSTRQTGKKHLKLLTSLLRWQVHDLDYETAHRASFFSDIPTG